MPITCCEDDMMYCFPRGYMHTGFGKISMRVYCALQSRICCGKFRTHML